MAIKDLFHTIFKSLNPESYDELNQRQLSDSIKYFFFIMIISLLLMFILFVPSLLSFSDYWSDKSSNFDSLKVNFSFQLKQSFYLFDDPLVRVEQSGSNLTDSRIIITEDGIFYKSFIFFGDKKRISLNSDYDFTETNPDISKLIFFLLPSLIFWSIILFMIYLIVIVVTSMLIFGILAWTVGYRMKPSRIIKICLYASTVLIILQTILMPFFRTIIIPVVAYWVLLLIILILFRDDNQSRSELRENSYSGSKKSDIKSDIFSKRESHEKNSYEESPKKRKTVDVDKENKDYVEWK